MYLYEVNRMFGTQERSTDIYKLARIRGKKVSDLNQLRFVKGGSIRFGATVTILD